MIFKQMKKVLSIAAVALLAIGSLASCKKCGHCTYPGSTAEPSVCDNGTLGKAYYNAYETSCSVGGGTWVKD